jgi:CDP-diacylglycerol---glycerol-3-phosphate 3-phosphatidyltransferase
VLLAPVLVVLLIERSSAAQYAGAGIFVLGAATDGLDGYLARRWQSRTRMGAWLDPLADKVLVLAAVVTLSALGRFPWWATAIIAVREVAISVVRILLGRRGRSLPASPGAKAKTAAQILAVALYILPLGAGADPLRWALLAVALVLTVLTGARYLIDAVAWLRRTPGRPAPAVGGTRS